MYTVLGLHTKNMHSKTCLEIPHGEFVGIIGHTGSGKSTLIQHLNRTCESNGRCAVL